ncbi:MAG: helicase associated domain-containing protein [Bacilli bacterium]|nr:helicase associated domain-containing protein [Bacilli bacterium]
MNIEPPDINLDRDTICILDAYIKGIDLYWYQMYDEVVKYHEKYGNINVPLDYITPNNLKLGIWINTQRDGWKKRGRLRTLTTQKINLLNALGMDWTPYETQWNEMYKLAEEYFNDNGDLFVNIKYEINGIALGQWISTQRQNKKLNKLSSERIKKLENIGMIWNPMQSSWEEYYQLAKVYYKENNNLNIPSDYIYNDKNLGMWIGSQRQKYKNKKISEDRIRLLNLLNMDWVGRDNEMLWNEMYILAKDYYDKYGNLKVPQNYQVNNKNLGNWIRNQRSNYNSKLLTEEQIAKLTAIDMIWNTIIEQWDKMYLYAKEYYEKNGNLDVPSNYKTADGINLGNWIMCQKDKYKNGMYKISSSQVKLLEEIGIVWDVAETNWFNNYNIAKEYYNANQHLLIPDTYVIDGIAIGRWIGTQRKNYKNKILEDNKIKLLNEIGMIWDVNVEKWQKMYSYALEYYNKHKNLNIPNKYKVNGYDISNWVVKQREKYKKGTLTKEQIKLLEDIEMNWNPTENLWEEMYDLANKYFKNNGNLMIPQWYEINNRKLGEWILSQRQLYKNNRLSSDKIEKLNAIKMNWNPQEQQWQQMFEEAKTYYLENGNLEIPQRYVNENGTKLGVWISNLRQNKEKLDKSKIEQLDKIGMVWKLKLEWEDFYELATEYFNEFGNINLKCREEYKGIKLGWWITNQKRYKKENKLSKEKIDKLDKIGLF